MDACIDTGPGSRDAFGASQLGSRGGAGSMPPWWSSLPAVISHSCNQLHASCGLAEISLQVNRLACAGPGPTNQTFWIRMRPEPFSRHASTRSGGVPASAQRPRGCPRCRPSCRACRSATSACHPGVVARPSPYGQGSRGGRLLTRGGDKGGRAGARPVLTLLQLHVKPPNLIANIAY